MQLARMWGFYSTNNTRALPNASVKRPRSTSYNHSVPRREWKGSKGQGDATPTAPSNVDTGPVYSGRAPHEFATQADV
jgi:hypothetical protein